MAYGEVTGYKINETKSVLIVLNIGQETKEQIIKVIRAPWRSQVKYLGIKITEPLELNTLIALNVNPVVHQVQQNLESWRQLGISWFGMVAVVKTKVLPTFIFLFQNLVLLLPLSILRKIQAMFSTFIWDKKKSRTKASTSQQKNLGGEDWSLEYCYIIRLHHWKQFYFGGMWIIEIAGSGRWRGYMARW